MILYVYQVTSTYCKSDTLHGFHRTHHDTLFMVGKPGQDIGQHSNMYFAYLKGNSRQFL